MRIGKVDFSPKEYLLFYLLVITPIVISFFVRRRNAPTRLNLMGKKQGEEENTAVPVPQAPAPPPQSPPQQPKASPDLASEIRRPPPRRQRAETPPPRPPPRAEKSLNVFFNWNGHSWDAFEVLGIPAGSSVQAAEAAYQELIARSGTDSHDFYKAAYDTIVRNSSAR